MFSRDENKPAMHPFSFLSRWFTFAFLMVVLGLTCSCGKQPERKTQPVAPATPHALLPHTQEAAPGPLVIIFEEPDPPQHAESSGVITVGPTEVQEAQRPKRPRVAIIIDDMGHHKLLGEQLLSLDLGLSYSFLPYGPFTEEQAQLAHSRGSDILVHLPMEPQDSIRWDPGKGALYVRDAPDQLQTKTKRLLARVPYATGANNHMGSRFSEDAVAMETVLSTLQEYDFFYIDSFTTARSQGMATAIRLGVPTERRHIFLDNEHNPEKICRQIEKLIRLAHQQGSAIGIGHPNNATLVALTQCDRQLLATVDVVGVHHLVR